MGNQHITSGTVITDTNSSALIESGGGIIRVDADALIFALAPGPGDAIELNDGPYTVTINGEAYSENDDGIDLVTIGSFLSTITVGASGTVFGVSNGIEAAHATNVTNSGLIRGEFIGLFEGGSGNFTITNKATGAIDSPDRGIFITNFGTHTINNAGLIRGILGFGIQGSFGVEKVTNWGKIIGDVSLGDGNDVFTNFKKVGTHIKNGEAFGDIDLGNGNDKFTGGSNAEIVHDGNGSDIVKLGGGNDRYFATGASGSDGTDIIDGGSGIEDLYDAAGASGDIRINLDSVAHANTIFVAANTAQGSGISDGFVKKDTITGFEDANGGPGNDIIYGNKAVNSFVGSLGADDLFGFGGNDVLSANDDVDFLVGGKGADTLFGGGADSAIDTFDYNALSDSTVARSGRDNISGFEDNFDRIDLSDIDAIAGGGDNSFSFIGVNDAFNGVAGELRAIWTIPNVTTIQGDVNGDKKADFAIDVGDIDHTIVWSGGDFIL